MDSTLSKQQIKDLTDRLQTRLEVLKREVHDGLMRADEEQYSELAGKVHDLEEASVADLLVDVNLAEIDRDIREIRDVEAALQRIGSGGYGTCVDCQEDIALERLQANPSALRCHRCQNLHEKTYKQPGQPRL